MNETTEMRPRLGECLRSLRRRLGLTLSEVSRRTGLSPSTLSKVENDQMSLTYDKLLQLALGLGIDISELFSLEAPGSASGSASGRRSFTPPGEGGVLQTRYYDYRYLCTELAGKKMVPIYGELRARTMEEFGPFIRHSGEEFTYVLGGVVEFRSEFYKPLRMEAGASIYFDATMGHAYLNAGPGLASILCVCSTPEAELALIAGADEEVAGGV